ncbi:glycosyltransferase [Nodosilinea sp. PGN35]|uniref:glycosyltransferase family protein n=1 Tax=Nodosilinea sp. PGN35 TaxID=3020489 RepID=UPI0023B2DEA4|nr:glycosyltransferase [Nodosilinea sp. TSF1-S3]MDF0369740.1 glycosyltransferase [Nodosilinea sp. TSF1-S3]
MARILILIGGHLCTAPRPQKEADALAAAGHDVTVAGGWFDARLVERDRALLAKKAWAFYPALDFRPGQRDRLGVRLQAAVARQLYRWLGLKTPALLGYGARRLLRLARTVSADLTIVHSEAGLWVGQRLMQQGYQVGVDFEDWFSQDLLPSARQTRPTAWIAELEAALLRGCSYRLAPSQAMAQAIAAHYCVTPPTVVYNVFPQTKTELPPACPHRTLRLHWFSQTIGPGRGLELLFEALPHLTLPVEVHLRGTCSPAHQTWLAHQIPLGWATHVHIHPTVPNGELPIRIAENDIGLALEQVDPPSRNLTVTNKLFQYLQAGLAVIATDTAGQREVFRQAPAIGHLVAAGDGQALAAAIEDLVCNPARLQAAKTAARHAAQSRFSWELEEKTLLAAAEMALTTALAGVNRPAPALIPNPNRITPISNRRIA